jgi:flavin-binding protein dodecin
MSNHTYKVVTIVGTSGDGITEAIESGICRARETLRHLDWFEVGNIRGHLSDDGVQHYQVELKVGFRVVDPGDMQRE